MNRLKKRALSLILCLVLCAALLPAAALAAHPLISNQCGLEQYVTEGGGESGYAYLWVDVDSAATDVDYTWYIRYDENDSWDYAGDQASITAVISNGRPRRASTCPVPLPGLRSAGRSAPV
jgi:hypothetical protein